MRDMNFPQETHVFWDIMPCQLVDSCRRFEGTTILRNVGKIYQSRRLNIPEHPNNQHRISLGSNV